MRVEFYQFPFSRDILSEREECSDFDSEAFYKYLQRLSLKILLGTNPSDAFFNLISRFPQQIKGELNYLLSSGLAISFYTRTKRRHRDIDLVMVNGSISEERHFAKIDVTSGSSFCNGMSFDDRYLKDTAKIVVVGTYRVWIVHPAILLVQKLSNRGKIPPRKKDIRDASLLSRVFLTLPRQEQETWQEIIIYSLNSFRDNDIGLIRERIENVLGKL